MAGLRLRVVRVGRDTEPRHTARHDLRWRISWPPYCRNTARPARVTQQVPAAPSRGSGTAIARKCCARLLRAANGSVSGFDVRFATTGTSALGRFEPPTWTTQVGHIRSSARYAIKRNFGRGAGLCARCSLAGGARLRILGARAGCGFREASGETLRRL